MKLRTCAVCSASFQSVRRDALYCSPNCRQKAHLARVAQLFPKAAHVGERGAVQSAIEIQGTTLANRECGIGATAPGRFLDGRTDLAQPLVGTGDGVSLDFNTSIDGQRNEVLAGGRREDSTLVCLKAKRTTLGAKGRQIESEAAPIHNVAESIGAETDSERAIRWLLALIMLCCDPVWSKYLSEAPIQGSRRRR
jgi:hypothetical protein